MKTPVATIERSESRDRPQMPCPEVQPLPSLVPKPTSSPPVTSKRAELVTVIAGAPAVSA